MARAHILRGLVVLRDHVRLGSGRFGLRLIRVDLVLARHVGLLRAHHSTTLWASAATLTLNEHVWVGLATRRGAGAQLALRAHVHLLIRSHAFLLNELLVRLLLLH